MTRVLNRDLVPYGFSYDYERNVFYAKMKPWYEPTGYHMDYDSFSLPHHVVTDSEFVPFEYDGQKWLVVMRKGQYGITTGAEIGIYKQLGNAGLLPETLGNDFYIPIGKECFPHITFSLWLHDSLLFKRSAKHWWLTGFLLGRFANPSELSMHLEFTFHRADFCNAFGAALKKMGYCEEECQIQGRSLWIIYDAPRCTQTRSKPLFNVKIIQWRNRFLVWLYNRCTPYSQTSLEQLTHTKKRFPWLYQGILSTFRTKKRFFQKGRIL